MIGKWLKFFLRANAFKDFDASGFGRHQSEFIDDEMALSMKNHHVLLTGGTRGIGYSVLKELYIREASQVVISRDKKNAISEISKFYKKSDKVKIDLLTGDLASYHEIIEALENRNLEPFNVLIFNAGGMYSSKNLNTFGYEYTFSSQLIGHYILFRWLMDNNLLAPGCRIIWVSCGEMYLKKLELDDLNFAQDPFYQNIAFANVKRAQVIVNEELANRYSDTNLSFFCMHPGWVKTNSLKINSPLFFKEAVERLRTPEQGADTIIWLSSVQKVLESGKFWFDRKTRRTNRYFWTKEKEMEREKLMDLLETQYQASTSVIQ